MVFVTGGSGLIGSYILYYLVRENQEVKALKRVSSDLTYTKMIFKYLAEKEPLPNGDTWELAFNRISWVIGDITDMDSLIEGMVGVDTVYHAAAIVSYKRTLAKKMIQTNVEGAANMVNACLELNIPKLAYVSSVAALNLTEGSLINETAEAAETTFNNAYAESKQRSEMEIWRGQAEGLQATIINPGIVLGWGNFVIGSQEMFHTVYKGLPFYPTGSTSFIDARDVAKTLILLSKNDAAMGQRFIAISETMTFKQIFDLIAIGFSKKVPSIRVKPALVLGVWVLAEIQAFFKRSDPFVTRDMALSSGRSYHFDGSKLKNLLGYEFIPMSKTISDTCEVYQKELEAIKGR